jgi:6-phosphogluconolactonase
MDLGYDAFCITVDRAVYSRRERDIAKRFAKPWRGRGGKGGPGVEDASGSLSELQYETLTPARFTGNARAADLHVTADGRFAYASVRDTSTVVGFRIDPANGRLSRIASFDVEGSPRAFAIEAQGRFLVCAGQTDEVVAVYAIDQESGMLTRRHQIPIGPNPSWVEILSLPAAP